MTASAKAGAFGTLGLLAVLAAVYGLHRTARKPPVENAPVTQPEAPRPPASHPAIASPANAAEIVVHAARGDLLAALQARLRQGAATSEICDLLRLIAQDRPAVAAEIAAQLSADPAQRYAFTIAVVDAWAATDGSAAWTWALAHSTTIDRPGERSLSAVALDRAAAVDVAGTIAFVTAHLTHGGGSGAENQGATRELVDALLAHNQLALARQTIDTWEQGDLRANVDNAALERISLQLAAQSTREAADWLARLPASPERTQAVATLATSFAATDPQGAMNWAASLDPSAGQSEAMQRVFNRWAQANVVDAAQWLADHESQPDADRLISNLIDTATLAQNNPALALRWTDLITDRELQARETTQVVLAWAAKDRAGATNYVANNSTLPAEKKKKLLEALVARPPEPSG